MELATLEKLRTPQRFGTVWPVCCRVMSSGDIVRGVELWLMAELGLKRSNPLWLELKVNDLPVRDRPRGGCFEL